MISDGQGQGNEGMRYSLPSRDLIADCIELILEVKQQALKDAESGPGPQSLKSLLDTFDKCSVAEKNQIIMLFNKYLDDNKKAGDLWKTIQYLV